jgi:hypothetical protein
MEKINSPSPDIRPPPGTSLESRHLDIPSLSSTEKSAPAPPPVTSIIPEEEEYFDFEI